MAIKIAVFASGSGGNFEAIVKKIKEGYIENCEISLLITDKKNIYVLDRAEKYKIKSKTIIPIEYENKEKYEEEILKCLKENNIDFIVLAGYMRLIGKTLLDFYEGKMINIHPSILPAFKGKDAIQMALDYGVKYTGVSIHWVDSGMDTGKIIEQEVVRVEAGETYDSLSSKIHKIEHKIYPEVLKNLFKGK